MTDRRQKLNSVAPPSWWLDPEITRETIAAVLAANPRIYRDGHAATAGRHPIPKEEIERDREYLLSPARGVPEVQRAGRFLSRIGKAPRLNQTVTVSALKVLCEHWTHFHQGSPEAEWHDGYVCNGAMLIAALASGFRVESAGPATSACRIDASREDFRAAENSTWDGVRIRIAHMVGL